MNTNFSLECFKPERFQEKSSFTIYKFTWIRWSDQKVRDNIKNTVHLLRIQTPSLQPSTDLAKLFTEKGLLSGHSAIKPRPVECCSDGCPSGSFSSHLYTGFSGAQPEWPSGSWSPLLSRLFFPDCSALGRVLVVPDFYYLRIMEATAECFFVAFPRSVPQHNPVSELCRQFFQTHGLAFALICYDLSFSVLFLFMFLYMYYFSWSCLPCLLSVSFIPIFCQLHALMFPSHVSVFTFDLSPSTPESVNSIQFYLYSAFNKGALSQSCFTENRPPMSKPRATVARKNSLAYNRKKPWAEPDSEGNHLPLVGTGFNPINLVHLDSSHVGRTRVPSWSRPDLRARRGRSGDLG